MRAGAHGDTGSASVREPRRRVEPIRSSGRRYSGRDGRHSSRAGVGRRSGTRHWRSVVGQSLSDRPGRGCSLQHCLRRVSGNHPDTSNSGQTLGRACYSLWALVTPLLKNRYHRCSGHDHRSCGVDACLPIDSCRSNSEGQGSCSVRSYRSVPERTNRGRQCGRPHSGARCCEGMMWRLRAS